MAASCGRISKKEKWSIFFYGMCVILWLLPGLSKYFMPAAYPMLSKINNCYPPLLALFLMNFIKVDGEKILEWDNAVKAANWPTVLFIASIMGLGYFMGSENIGLSNWLSDSLEPIFKNISPLAFLFIMVLAVNILTNLCSNAVALSVVFTVALPLAMNIYSAVLSPMLVAILVTSSAQNGWATPPATPPAAAAYSSGWGNNRIIFNWGMIIVFIQIAICMAVGIPLSELFIK